MAPNETAMGDTIQLTAQPESGGEEGVNLNTDWVTSSMQNN